MDGKIPHYMTVVVNLIVTDGEGSIRDFGFEVRELDQDGLLPQVAKVIDSLGQRGVRPLTEKEYTEMCVRLQEKEQRKQIAQVASDMAEKKVLDPAVLDGILARHRAEGPAN